MYFVSLYEFVCMGDLRLQDSEDKLADAETKSAQYQKLAEAAATKHRQSSQSTDSLQQAFDTERERADEKDNECRSLQQQLHRLHQLEVDVKLGQEQCNRLIKEKAGLGMDLGHLKVEVNDLTLKAEEAQNEADLANGSLQKLREHDMAELKAANSDLMKEVHELSANVAQHTAEVQLKEQKLRASQDDANRQLGVYKLNTYAHAYLYLSTIVCVCVYVHVYVYMYTYI